MRIGVKERLLFINGSARRGSERHRGAASRSVRMEEVLMRRTWSVMGAVEVFAPVARGLSPSARDGTHEQPSAR